MQQKEKPSIDESTSLCDTKFKIVFLGDTGVGKTSIIERFVRNQFDSSANSTVGIDFLSRNITLHQRTFRLQLWDTAGQEKYKSLVPAYLRDAHAAVLVYDPSRPETFDNLPSWLQLFRDHQAPNAIALLVASKTDLLEDGVNPLKQQAQKLAQREDMSELEVSAKNGTNVTQLFTSTVQKLCKPSARGKEEEEEVEKVVTKLGGLGKRSLCCV